MSFDPQIDFSQSDMSDLPNRRPRLLFQQPWAGWLVLATCLLTVIVAQVFDWPRPVRSLDFEQLRLSDPLPPPSVGHTMSQTFVPRHNGFSEVELLIVHFDEANGRDDEFLTVKVIGPRGELLAERSWSNTAVKHNQGRRLRFDPQPNSAGMTYRLEATGTAENQLSLWGYSQAVIPNGQFEYVGSETAVESMRFTTRYNLLWMDAVKISGRLLVRHLPVMIVFLSVVLMPGLWMLALLNQPITSRLDRWSYVGLALVAGLSIWVLIWQWASLVNFRFSGWLLWVIVVFGWLGWLWRMRERILSLPSKADPVNRWFQLGFPAMLLFVLTLRLLAVRELAFLPWVDSSRHALIIAAMRDGGRLIENYLPYLTVTDVPYHLGFHSVATSVALMLGPAYDPVDGLIGIMQLMSVLAVVVTYAGGYMLTGRRSAAWIAAFLVGIPFFFPAYYSTWGRLTQLMGMLILPILAGVSWQSVRSLKSFSFRNSILLIGLLAAGLFLIHIRVFFLYLPFAALVVGIGLVQKWLQPNLEPSASRIGGPIKLLSSWSIAAVICGGLVFPRFLYLLQTRPSLGAFMQVGGNPQFNRLTSGYIDTGWEEIYWWSAAIATVTVLLTAWWLRARFSERVGETPTLVVMLALWVGVLWILTAGANIHPAWPRLVPRVDLNSMYIVLYMAESWVLGMGVGWIVEKVMFKQWISQLVGNIIVGCLIAIVGMYGIRQNIHVLNDVTILARPADRPAIIWMNDNLPADAKIAVNSWQWLGQVWAGSDGGAWITPLTGLETTTPPVDYTFDPALKEAVFEFNKQARAVESWAEPAAAEFLRRNGVTHIYAGERGGYFDPAELLENPDIDLLFAKDGAFVFIVQP